MQFVLEKEFSVLDHGFIRPVSVMGSDQSVVEAARVSYGKVMEKQTFERNRNLIRYLMKHNHTSPFEMCEIKLHIKLPIFVARQWLRHRTANVNEISGRYTVFDECFYIPDVKDICEQSRENHQGRAASSLEEKLALKVQSTLSDLSHKSFEVYNNLCKLGVSREISRMSLTMNYYTEIIWKIDLNNLFKFLKLRLDPTAQLEIRKYARVILEIVERWVPLCYEAFQDYILGAVSFSNMELDAIRGAIDPKLWNEKPLCLSQREWRELKKVFEANGF